MSPLRCRRAAGAEARGGGGACVAALRLISPTISPFPFQLSRFLCSSGVTFAIHLYQLALYHLMIPSNAYNSKALLDYLQVSYAALDVEDKSQLTSTGYPRAVSPPRPAEVHPRRHQSGLMRLFPIHPHPLFTSSEARVRLCTAVSRIGSANFRNRRV
ncbi:hypothetical protein EVAR_44091_1 [Eumeta japonica]|uniref:Uncharacterized protein n=1 Tax=Eumeta variegata TaxID=151549 RepID=A0A4C1X4M7_EUMVA|nr:hypothetical protein EVAR_44091_1 [Eumeta japonica]